MITIPSGLYLKKKLANEILYAGLTGGTTKIVKSIDSGLTWTDQNVTLNGDPIIFCKDDSGNIYCGTNTGYVYKNWSGGWINPYLYSQAITNLDIIDGYIYTSNDQAIPMYKLSLNLVSINSYSFASRTKKVINNYIFGPNGIWTLSGTQILADVNIAAVIDMGNGFIYFSTSNGNIYVNTTVNDYTAWTFKNAISYNVIFGKKYGDKIIFLTTPTNPGTIIYDTINNSMIIASGNKICAEKLNEKIIYGTDTGYIILSNDGLVTTQSMKLFNATSVNAIIKI